MKDPKKIWRARASRKAASLQSFKLASSKES
jgi:hypothetical protein